MDKVFKDATNLIGNTPMLLVNNIDTGHCNLYLKLESTNLGGSVKDRPARNMIRSAEKQGLLRKGGTIVEATAGNTGIALSIMAVKKGYKVIIVVPNKMTVEKIFHLKALGAQVIIARSDVVNGHPEYYLEIAKKIAEEKNAFYVNQFSNLANLNSHFQELGPEIYKQLNGEVDAFVAGVGTGGTITGVGKYLKSKKKDCELILADPKGSILKNLVKTGKLSKDVGSWIVEGIGEDFCPQLLDEKIIDDAYTINDEQAIKTCSELLKKEGILAGSSSGTLIAAAIKYCRKQTKRKNVVTLVCDAGDKYLRKIYNESWRIKEGLDFRRKEHNLCDLVSYRNESNLLPVISKDSNCNLAFKLMHENNTNYILVNNNKKEVIGIINDTRLLDVVSQKSFQENIGSYIIRLKKIQYNESINKLTKLIRKYEYILVYKGNLCVGVVSKIDLLWYLKKREKC
ncbi:MAG: cystathionine beta-synthase [Rickettsiales bacterium]|nr:cystathionine beta-synthase [Rickettsiales bacterium]